jgi:iron uptake system component EfeO
MSRSALVVLVLPVVVLAACGSDKPSSSGKDVVTIDVTLSDTGCEPRQIAAQAGPTTFHVVNDGSAAVTEFEVLSGTRILGEVENVTPGADRDFSLNLTAGSYTTKCPGGSQFEAGTLEVADAATGAAADTAARDAAVQTYLSYVKKEADQLITAIGPFAAAVKGGDIATAKNLFAGARAHYESIEPIAESFGDLDPAIDAREGDVPDAEWGGFHRIEKALWVDNDVSSMGTVADKLVADVQRLRTQIDTVKLEPAQIANGAVELLNEVSTSKITGEEDRYSHTDLSDFEANLAGSKAAFEALQPLLTGDSSALSTQIEDRFAAVQSSLDQHRGDDPTGNGYALYNTLTANQTRTLSTTLDTLAEPLSRVAAEVL